MVSDHVPAVPPAPLTPAALSVFPPDKTTVDDHITVPVQATFIVSPDDAALIASCTAAAEQSPETVCMVECEWPAVKTNKKITSAAILFDPDIQTPIRMKYRCLAK
jgi:hypothetical protein